MSVLKKMFGTNMSPKRLAVLNGLDRILSFQAYYAISSLCQVNPALGVTIALVVEMVVVHWALRKINNR